MSEWLTDLGLLCVASVVGTLGIALLFGEENKKIPWALLAAVLATVGYEVTFALDGGYFLSSFVAAGLVAAYADFSAHFLKTPATVIIITGIVPLVPGGKLFYTMLGAVTSDMTMFSDNGFAALKMAAGLAIGIIGVTAISRPLNARIGEAVKGKSNKQ